MPSRALGRHAAARRVSRAPSRSSREILLFDEPTTGLDPVITALIDELIVELRETLGSTTVSPSPTT